MIGPRRLPLVCPSERHFVAEETGAGGAVSEVSLTGSSGVEGMRSGVEVHTRDGVHAVDGADAVDATAFVTMAREFAGAVRTNTPHALDVHRGVHLQRLLAAALADLRR